MEFIKQTLVTNNIDLGDLEEVASIFEALGNQQEPKKIYALIKKYLKKDDIKFSIWQFENRQKSEMVWMSDEPGKRSEYEKKESIINQYRKHKKPIFEVDEDFYALIPIVAREETKGFLCLHEEIPIDERWKKIYVVTTMLGQVFKYYEMVKMVKELSIIDLTTGLFNYRHFKLQIGLEVEKANRYKKPLSLTVFRIKDFDIINEKLGFSGGEEVVKEFSAILKKLSRATDMPSRIDESTFAVLMYETDKKGGETFVKRVMKYLRDFPSEILEYEFHIESDANVVEYNKEMSTEMFLKEAMKA